MHDLNRFLLLCTLSVTAPVCSFAWGQSTEYRRLAPGVIKVVEPRIEEEETFSGPREMTELLQYDLAWQPRTLAETATLASMAKQVIFRRQIWGLEFGFKPLRMIEAGVEGSTGLNRPQKVYYLVYYVKNNGQHLNPAAEEDEYGNVTYKPEQVKHSLRFFPTFSLKAHDVGSAYLDEILPNAVARIRQREDANRTFYDSVSISSVNIPVSTEFDDNRVWAVATWTDVDPRSDFLSVYIQGLTNAYRWVDPPGAFQAGDSPMQGRRFTYKTLQINFWRPGDAIQVSEDEIRYGVPNENEVPSGRTADEVLRVYGLEERLDYQWVYR